MKVLDLLVPPTSLSWPSLTVIRLPGWVRPGRRPGVRHVLTGVWSHPAVWRQGLRHRVADVDRRQRLRSLSEVQRLESCLPRRRSVDTGGQMSNNLNRSRFSSPSTCRKVQHWQFCRRSCHQLKEQLSTTVCVCTFKGCNRPH